MTLIDADELRRQTETCRETTDDFIELIDKQPIYVMPEQHCNDSGHPSMAEGAWYTCPICGGPVRPHIDTTCITCNSIMLWR